MANDVTININAKDNTKGAIASVDAQFKKFASTIQSATIIATGVAVALDKAFEFAERGAQVLQTAQSWDTLMASIGASPDLLDRLTEAAGGTIGQLEIMQSTSLLLAGTQGDLATSLAEATPQLLEIARAAAKLNPSLGDTTFLYDSLARGIKRGSPLILDNLGIMIKMEDAYAAYAASLGKSADALTVEEQKIAILNAVLEQGGTLIDQAGGNVDNLTDSFARMDVSAQALSDTIATQLAPGLGKSADAGSMALDIATQLIQSWSDASAESKKMSLLITAGGGPLRVLSQAFATVEAGAKAFDLALREMETTIEKGGLITDQLNASTEQLTWTFTGGAYAIGELSRGVDTVSGSLEKSTWAQDRYSESLRASMDASREAQGAYAEMIGAMDSDVASPIAAFIDDLKFMIAGGGEIAGEFASITDALTSQQITPEQAQGMLENLFIEAQNISVEAGLTTSEEAASKVSEQLGVPLDEAYTKLTEIGTEFDALAALDHTVTMNIETNIMAGASEFEFLQRLADERVFSISIEAGLFEGATGGARGGTRDTLVSRGGTTER